MDDGATTGSPGMPVRPAPEMAARRTGRRDRSRGVSHSVADVASPHGGRSR